MDSYEQKLTQGLGEQEVATIPGRLESDCTLIASEKRPYPLCTYINQLARDQGFGDVLLEDHDFTQKMTKEYRLFCPNRILNIV